jgi:pimeloyl-ACP methyl ester carboxylesterase
VLSLVLSMVASAAAQPPLPGPVRDLLERVGVPPRAIDSMLRGRGSRATVTDPLVAALMARARREDVVVSATDRLFDKPTVELGLWESATFLGRYGTALFLAAPWDERRIPMFLVHGISGSPRDFATLLGRFEESPYQPVLFFYPTGMPLAEASRHLGARLQEFLRRHPTRAFGIVGHSMGGLVAKGLLDEIDVPRRLPGWKVFVGISSPWGGVPAAAFGDRLPNHPPAWDDLAPGSSFMSRIDTTPVPSDVAFYLFFGARSRPSFLAALGNNDGRLTVDTMNSTRVTASARDVFGFYEDHLSILSAPRVLDRLERVLDANLGRATSGRHG